jgi:hypothetical protein
MRIIVLCVAILLGVGTAARADEPDPFLSVSEAKPLRERWQDCAASAVKPHLDTSRSAEAIADMALASCKAREAALANVLRRRVGLAAARRIVAELRTYDRLVLTRIIERLRGN